jgi:hypothetical protein
VDAQPAVDFKREAKALTDDARELEAECARERSNGFVGLIDEFGAELDGLRRKAVIPQRPDASAQSRPRFDDMHVRLLFRELTCRDKAGKTPTDDGNTDAAK